MSRVFVDTNILVYAVDEDAGEKSERAKAALKPFYHTDIRPVISVQVVHEFAYRLFRWGMNQERVETLLRPMYHWRVVSNDLNVFREAMALKQRFQLSFWDSLILAAALVGQADEIWSEDFNTGQDYAGILAVNPMEA